jgi:hypothetical protein
MELHQLEISQCRWRSPSTPHTLQPRVCITKRSCRWWRPYVARVVVFQLFRCGARGIMEEHMSSLRNGVAHTMQHTNNTQVPGKYNQTAGTGEAGIMAVKPLSAPTSAPSTTFYFDMSASNLTNEATSPPLQSPPVSGEVLLARTAGNLYGWYRLFPAPPTDGSSQPLPPVIDTPAGGGGGEGGGAAAPASPWMGLNYPAANIKW